MRTGRRRFIFRVLEVSAGIAAAGLAAESRATASAAGPSNRRRIRERRADPDGVLAFDFGPDAAPAVSGSQRVSDTTTYSPERGYGWLTGGDLVTRERMGTDPQSMRSFVFSAKPRTLRIAGLPARRYLITVRSGDPQYGDHTTHIRIPGRADDLPALHPEAGEYALLTLVAPVSEGQPLEIAFEASAGTWIINTLRIEPTELPLSTKPSLTFLHGATYRKAPEIKNEWGPVLTAPTPTTELLKGHRLRMKSAPSITPTGLRREDYLRLIAGEIDFWKGKQNADGAIIDLYKNVEIQYSTPAFAHAAAALVVWAGRKDLIEPASKALTWSTSSLSARKAASGHEDFFAPLIAHAIRLLKPHVAPEQSAKWEADIRRFDPFATYRAPVGKTYNWNLVAACGEALFQQMGLRDRKNRFVEASLAGQGGLFDPAWGVYLEGPMAYDAFPRLWVSDLIASGYDGPYARKLAETLRRGAITSLFMQSPWGELPAGGRSAQHQWNEAEQCVIFEVFASRAHATGDDELAGIFKRAAHFALRSMRRWVRPSGEMQIVKNWVDPAKEHGFETYSSNSQYNLLPCAMLALAYEHAEATETIPETPVPAEIGGFLLSLEPLHKVFANVRGTYIEIDTAADHHYDATGLIRVHMPSVSPQIGPSDSLLSHPAYRVPRDSAAPPITGIGVAWQSADAAWHTFGELTKDDIATAQVTALTETPERVSFILHYTGNLAGVASVEETFILDPEHLQVTTRLSGYVGLLRRLVPVLADDGRMKTEITAHGNTVLVAQSGSIGGGVQTYTAEEAASVNVSSDAYPNHNGWAKLVTAEYPAGSGDHGVRLVVTPLK